MTTSHPYNCGWLFFSGKTVYAPTATTTSAISAPRIPSMGSISEKGSVRRGQPLTLDTTKTDPGREQTDQDIKKLQ